MYIHQMPASEYPIRSVVVEPASTSTRLELDANGNARIMSFRRKVVDMETVYLSGSTVNVGYDPDSDRLFVQEILTKAQLGELDWARHFATRASQALNDLSSGSARIRRNARRKLAKLRQEHG